MKNERRSGSGMHELTDLVELGTIQHNSLYCSESVVDTAENGPVKLKILKLVETAEGSRGNRYGSRI